MAVCRGRRIRSGAFPKVGHTSRNEGPAMKRRRLLLFGLVVVLLTAAALYLLSREPDRTRLYVEAGGGLRIEMPQPTWWDRVQDRCRKLTGWPPAPAVTVMSFPYPLVGVDV